MEDRRMKKIYMKPSINVYEIKQSQILCGSPTDPNTWPYPGAYIPGVGEEKNMMA